MTKVKNYIIKNMAENGLENTTDHDLSAAHAYRVFVFRDETTKAYKDIEEKRQKLVKDILGDDFENKRKELDVENPTDEQKEELDKLNGKLQKFLCLFNELMNDESELNVKTIPFEAYHTLARENKQTVFQVPDKDGNPTKNSIDFFAVFRPLLKGVLWEEPED